jgi:hypothetical protein
VTVSSSDPSSYLSIAGLADWRHGGAAPASGSATASIHAAADGSRLLTIAKLDEIGDQRPNEAFMTDDFALEKRSHLVTAADLLIVIPFSTDRVFLQRMNLCEAPTSHGGDYLIVASPTRLRAQPARLLAHQIEALSKAGDPRCTLTQGPNGMTVSSGGNVSWLPPKGVPSGEIQTAVNTVADASGQERFHTLRIGAD